MKLNKRNYVYEVEEYCKDSVNRVMSICGLRGTGKTTGILQAIHDINDYDNTVYIDVGDKAGMSCFGTLACEDYMEMESSNAVMSARSEKFTPFM